MKNNFTDLPFTILPSISEDFLGQTGIFPLDYFHCPDPDDFTNECKSQIQKYCDMEYSPPSYIDALQSQVTEFFLVNTGSQCLCYTSAIVAPGIGTGEKSPNMCFSNYCTASRWVDAFNLSDDDCKSQCDVVWNWIQNNQVQGAYLDRFNTNKYAKVCGDTYTQWVHNSFNIPNVIELAVAAISGF